MILHIFSRVLYYLSVFVGIILFSFFLFHVVPSDPARIILGPNAGEAQVQALREKLGLNKPVYLQLADYMVDVATLDFGRSFLDGRNVFHEVTKRLKITLSLVAMTMLIVCVYLVCVILTFFSRPLQKCSDYTDLAMSSVPVFFSGVIVALLTLYYYPVTSFSGNLSSIDDLLYLIPPGLVLAFYPMAILSGMLKQEMATVLGSLYITAEKSWGFSNIIILFKFALRNTLTPILSAVSNILPVLITGAFIVEIIFSIPGIGSLLVTSIMGRDFPMLECTVIVNGAFFVAVNLCFESLYPLIDPRIVKESG